MNFLFLPWRWNRSVWNTRFVLLPVTQTSILVTRMPRIGSRFFRRQRTFCVTHIHEASTINGLIRESVFHSRNGWLWIRQDKHSIGSRIPSPNPWSEKQRFIRRMRRLQLRDHLLFNQPRGKIGNQSQTLGWIGSETMTFNLFVWNHPHSFNPETVTEI